MRSLTTYVVLLIFFATSSRWLKPRSLPVKPALGIRERKQAGGQRVAQEVAAQRKTIEELKAIVQKLAEDKSQASVADPAHVEPTASISSPDATPASGNDTTHLVNTVLTQPEPVPKPQSSIRRSRRHPQERRSAYRGMERRAFLHQKPGWTVQHQPLRLCRYRLPRLQRRRRPCRHLPGASRPLRLSGQLWFAFRLCVTDRRELHHRSRCPRRLSQREDQARVPDPGRPV